MQILQQVITVECGVANRDRRPAAAEMGMEP